MLTLDQLKAMPPNTCFATGIVQNSPEGAFMTRERQGDNLRWCAQRGRIHDWAIYINWENWPLDLVLSNGDKIFTEQIIKKLVPCTDEAFNMYRY